MENKLSPNSNLLWESSRMMLPEHKALLRKHEDERDKKEMPLYDEQLLEQLAYTISSAFNKKERVNLTYYEDNDYIEISGIITRVNDQERSIQLQSETEDLTVYFNDLISVELDEFS